MKKLATLLLLISIAPLCAQTSTEVYLADITTKNGKTELTNLRNISNNERYDNQPSFYDDNAIVFAATRNGQTDIAKYDINLGEISWLTDTSVGSEYSPTRIPGYESISAIRLDTTGYQRLYRYDISKGTSEELLKDQKIGYHVWHSKDILVATVLVDDRMDLILNDLIEHTGIALATNVGRALHKIPNSNLVSFISKKDGLRTLNSIDPDSGAIKLISPLPSKTEDVCWLADGSFLVPESNRIYKFTPTESKKQPVIIDLSEFKEIHNISRMSVSPDGNHIALVSEEPPSKIAQKTS